MGLYGGYIGIMEKKMETTVIISTRVFFRFGRYRGKFKA